MSDNICVINAKSGIGTSSPQISQFTNNCDCIKFVIDKDFTSFALVVISSINGEVSVVSEGEYLLKSFDSQTGQTTALWYPSSQITKESGCVIYQLAAYDTTDNKTIWYSKEGRLIVTDSIDTNDYSASSVGSEPNLVMQLLTLAKSLEVDIENLSSTKVDKEEGKTLSQNDYTNEEKEKLSKATGDIEAINEAIDQIDLAVSDNSQAIDDIHIKFSETDEILSDYLNEFQNCGSKIEGLNDDVANLQGLIEENKGEESYDSQSPKAQSGKAVAQAVAGIVDSAPETLNTLEELAKALGNDPNFATSIMTLLGGKVDKESGKTLSSNDFSDEDKETINYLSQQHEIFLNELGTSVYPAIEKKVEKEDSFGLIAIEPYFDPESDEEDPYTWDKAELTNHFYDSYENKITERGVTVYSAEGADKRLAEKIDKTSIITTLEDADANHDNNNVIPSIPFLIHNFISEGRIAESKEAIWDTQTQIPCIELVIQLINSAIGDALEADY